jgi:hypothetical protein
LGIRYDYIPNERRISKDNRDDIAVIKDQLAACGDFPLTKKFVSNLGRSANLELRAMRKRKMDEEEEDQQAWRVATSSDSYAGISSHCGYHAPSPPLLTTPISGPPATNTTAYRGTSPIPDLMSSLIQSAKCSLPTPRQRVPHTTQQPLVASQDSFHIGGSAAAFDLALLEHLRGIGIPQSAVALMLHSPALAEQTRESKQRFEEQLREEEDWRNADRIQEGVWLREIYGGEKKKVRVV